MRKGYGGKKETSLVLKALTLAEVLTKGPQKRHTNIHNAVRYKIGVASVEEKATLAAWLGRVEAGVSEDSLENSRIISSRKSWNN